MTEDASLVPGAAPAPARVGIRQRYRRFLSADRLPDGTAGSIAYDVTGGIVLATACFVADPFLLRDWSGMGGMLSDVRTGAYAFVALQMAVLAFRLVTRSRSAAVAGWLTAGFAAALLASVWFVPFGLLVLLGGRSLAGLIGLFGLVPAWTAHAFWRNAERTWMAEARTPSRVRAAAAGCAAACVLAYGAQLAGDAAVHHAVAQATARGGDARALRALRPVAFALNLRPVADAYWRERDPARKKAIDAALAYLTGHEDALERASYADD